MITFARTGLCAAAALVLVCGCDTIKRAREAQTEVVPVGLEESSAPGEVKRVDLRGLRLKDYDAWAMNHRPSIEAAHLAVANAELELARVTSDRDLQLNLSSGFSQSTLNRTSHFSWRQNRGKFTSDVSLDLLIYDFGRIDARERQARENLVAAQRDLADAEFAVFNDVAQAYFTLLQNDALLEVART
ncbi:MAG: TolC family protein, partial [Kiritimatiellae bacterium]|nr:TolC family protein [Kiritimatiellia bacterium]